MSTIDHKQESEFLLQRVGGLTWEEAPQIEVALAQVHATLALVEQQRIANLIAFIAVEGGPYKIINEIPGATVQAIAFIREGLGL